MNKSPMEVQSGTNIKTYTRSEVKESTLAYFKGKELEADVWINKYCLKDSDGNLYELNPNDMHRRIAKELARIESHYKNPRSEEEIFEAIRDFKRLVPQGGPMSGIGNDLQIVSLSNCFVIGDDGRSDSYGGIMKIDQEQVQLMKRRGGVGHDLSHIRPKGTPVKNSALTSTGIVPFMERYSNSTNEVAQDGRRGALMLSVNIKHPDSEGFINAKMTEGKVTGANVSVKIEDEFMEAAMGGTSYLQTYPIDLFKIMSEEKNATMYLHTLGELKLHGEFNKLYPVENSEGKKIGYVKKIDAKKIWDKIIHNAWESAEPGILFWDNIIKESIPDVYGDLGYKTVSTNPCVSEDTLILTDNGYHKIVDRLNQKTNIWNGEEFSEVTPSITGENQEMVKIMFSDGSELKCTHYHGFFTWEGFSRDGKSVKKEARDLVVGDKLEKYDFPKLTFANKEQEMFNYSPKTFYTLGLFAGDGTLKRNKPFISLYGEKKKLIDKISAVGNVSEDIVNDKITAKLELPNSLICDKLKTYVPTINHTLENSLSWLAGLIDSDGSRNSEDGSISISSINRGFLIDIKLHLLNLLGVNCHVINEKDGGLKEIKGREYETNDSYRLIISAFNVKTLYDLGLRTCRVKIDDVNPNRDAGRFITVKSIEVIENAEKVYCFTEEKRGRGCFNGVVTSNCGEIPLCPYDSCRLLAINLYNYVLNPFTDHATFDYGNFRKDVILAQRLMDDIVDLEIEKIDGIIKKIDSDPEDEFVKIYEKNLWTQISIKAREARRTGLGVTGEGDMLAALGLTYGTDDANAFSEDIHMNLKHAAYESSVIMAKERGAFEIYSAEREEKNPFILRIKEEKPELYAAMVKYGRRNIAALTIAPTGTASLMTQTTSGIEPVFLPVYKRRRKINPNDKDARVDFVDEVGVSWMEYPVFHHNFETWLTVNDYDVDVVKTMSPDQVDEIVKKSPYHKATSNDVDWVKKVEMQGMVQKHVDHSISVTVNLPADATEDIVRKVYEMGWSCGCKGITVYRDGSRSGVLISNKKKEEVKINDNNAPKRPKRLKADIIRFQNNLEKWIGVVGMYEGRPYELFTGRLENGLSSLPVSVTECEVVKNIIEVKDKEGKLVKTKRYDIEYIDSNGEKHTHTGLNHTFDPEYWNYAKMISGVLRHGMPIGFVYELVRSLNLHDEHLNTWKAGVERIIKRYFAEGEKAKGLCHECGSEHLIYKEGCLICTGCGTSKCG